MTTYTDDQSFAKSTRNVTIRQQEGIVRVFGFVSEFVAYLALSLVYPDFLVIKQDAVCGNFVANLKFDQIADY